MKHPHRRKRINKRFFPNLATVFNMFLGFLALGLILKGDPVRAAWLLLIAGAFDAIDGKLARLFGIPSRFGTEFDSFADTISFCVVPSLLVYSVYVKGMPFLPAGMISFVPLLFGTIRLARFNVAEEEAPKSYYTGLTTPLAAIMIVSYLLFNYQLNGQMGDARIALVLVMVLGFLMISPVRFPKLPLLSFKRGPVNSLRLVGLLTTLVLVLIWRGLVLFPLVGGYIMWSILKWVLDHNRFDEEVVFKSVSDE